MFCFCRNNKKHRGVVSCRSVVTCRSVVRFWNTEEPQEPLCCYSLLRSVVRCFFFLLCCYSLLGSVVRCFFFLLCCYLLLLLVLLLPAVSSCSVVTCCFFLFCCSSSSETQKNPKNRSVVTCRSVVSFAALKNRSVLPETTERFFSKQQSGSWDSSRSKQQNEAAGLPTQEEKPQEWFFLFRKKRAVLQLLEHQRRTSGLEQHQRFFERTVLGVLLLLLRWCSLKNRSGVCFWNTEESQEPLLSAVSEKQEEHQRRAVLQLPEHQRRAVLSFKARKQEEHQNKKKQQVTTERFFFWGSSVFQKRTTEQEEAAGYNRAKKQRTTERQVWYSTRDSLRERFLGFFCVSEANTRTRRSSRFAPSGSWDSSRSEHQNTTSRFKNSTVYCFFWNTPLCLSKKWCFLSSVSFKEKKKKMVGTRSSESFWRTAQRKEAAGVCSSWNNSVFFPSFFFLS